MTHETNHGPIIDFDAEPRPEQEAEVMAQLRKAMQPPPPVPRESFKVLFEAAWGDTGGSQAARNFLFWLTGWEDPTGFKGCGGLELRRLDARHRAAALEVLAWWAGPTKSDQPLYEILHSLNQKFGGPGESD